MMSGSPWCLPCLGVRQPQAGSRVVLNVGGHRFTTVRSTLTTGRAAGSVLADLVSGPCDQDGSYFLDHDGTQFHFVLNFLRHGPELFVAPETSVALLSLQLEAKAFGLADLVDLLESKKPLARAQQGHTGAYLNAEDYMGAPHPANEVERMAKLRSLNVIDTVNEDTEYDNITRAVASILQVPICLVSLVAEDKQWFKSKCGLDADETARSSSFCAYTLFPEAVEDARMLVVTDARHDIRFMKNPLVLGEPYIQFYAGCPLVTSEGLRLGSLCAIDRIPRDVRPAEVGLLINFAHLVVQALEDNHLEKLHQELRGEDSDEEPKEEEVHWYGGKLRTEAMLDARQAAVVLVWARPDSMEWTLFFANKAFAGLTGVEVIAPYKFPGEPQVKVCGKMSTQASFWDHIRLVSREPTQVMELWKTVAVAMTGRQLDTKPGGFAARATVKQSSRQQEGKIFLNCRFTPAEVPLSETTAAVKNPGLRSTEKWPRPRGWPAEGHWFFIQMIPELMANGSMSRQPSLPQEAEATKPQTPPLLSMVSSTGVTESRQLDGGASVGTRPPTSPFQDVRLVRLVGQGSFGAVYFSLWSGAAVAVKIIKTVIPAGKDLAEVDKNPHYEASLSVSISHPNLVQTFKHGGRVSSLHTNGGAEAKELGNVQETWIVQEWCDGGTLRAACQSPKLEDQGLLEALEICMEISRAGQYLHDIGIIHGDLSGNNVLLKSMPVPKGYVCKVCDFGLARVLDGESKEIITKTLGTVTHMPPELLSLSEKCSLTQKADVYALGIISYQVYTGQEPFAGFSAPQVVIQVARGKRPQLPKEAPESLVKIFQETLASNPDERPTFGVLVDRLTQLYSDLGGAETGLDVLDTHVYRKSETYPQTMPRKASKVA